MISQLQTNLQQRMKEQQEQHANSSMESNQKVKQLEREKGMLQDRLDLQNRDQMSEVTTL